MYWPDTGTGVDVEPARKPVASVVRKFFTEGGLGQPPTVPGGDWFNAITNELINVLEAAGIEPDKADDTQLLEALQRISKAMSAREALRRSYAEAGYNMVSGSFELGGTVSTSTDVLLYEADGHAYGWDGVFPGGGKVVPTGSTPDTTGGVGPDLWLDKSAETLRGDLFGDGGFGRVCFKPSEIATAVKRSLEDWLRDYLVADVKWFGAKGDWNCGPSQTGTDDTAAVQSAVTFLATLGNRRNGAVRKLHFPMGNYRLSSLPLPIGISFALTISGDGNFASQLFFDNTDLSPGMDCVIESISFSNIALLGSLSDTVAGTPSAWKDIGLKARNHFNTTDVDVKFSECTILYWKEFSHVYGRGIVFDNCEIGQINALINIVCDPTITFLPGNALGSVETGMRNYVVRNCRTDQIYESLIKVSGTGPQKEYINGIAIRDCDFVATVKLIDAPDATLRRLSVGSNTALYSFRAGVISAKGVYSAIVHDCNLARRYEETIEPTGFNDAIPFIIATTAQLHDVDVNHCVVRNLSGTPVSTTGVASGVSVKDNDFPNAWTYFESGSNIAHVFFSPSNCPNLQIDGNNFASSVTTRTYRLFNPDAQTDRNTVIGVNPAPWNWVDSRLSYNPNLLVNGVPTAATPSGRSGRYHYDGKFCHVDIMLIVAMTETTGALSFSLPPITAIAENQGVTASFSGGGDVNLATGFSVPGAVFSRITVNPATQRAELWRESGMVRTAVSAADKTGTVSLYVSFKYRA